MALSGIGIEAKAQTTINSTGGNAVIGNTIHEWSVGESGATQTLTGSSLIVTQGLLQPSRAETKGVAVVDLSGKLDVFPNPAANTLFLKYHFSMPGRLECRLLDAAGRLVSQKSFILTTSSGTESLDLQDIAAGTYLLNVRFEDQHNTAAASVFTIQKTL